MQFSKFLLTFPILVILGVACNSADFRSQARGPDANNKTKKTDSTSGSGGGADGSGDQNGTGGSGGSDGSGGAANTARFKYGPKLTPNDILFVFDNSVSMNPYIDRVREGFRRLNASDWYGDTRMAVMTTMPGNPANLSEVHPAVSDVVINSANGGKPYNGITLEPGFLSLISQSALMAYKQANATFVSAYSQPLCTDEWFKPDSVNGNNVRCLNAALQNPFFAVGCEAGLTALGQIHDKRGKIFRDGAFAHVVFVSDAQDPGCGGPNPTDANSSELLRNRPTSQQLRAKINSKNRLAGLRFHGVVTVPNGGKTNETTHNGDYGYPYNKMVDEDKGVLLDITSSSDYSAFAGAIARYTSVEPVFKLPVKVSKVNSVKVSGKALAADKFKLSADRMSVRIDGLDPKIDVEISVEFTP